MLPAPHDEKGDPKSVTDPLHLLIPLAERTIKRVALSQPSSGQPQETP